LDIEAVFPEMASLARTAVRLHPRPGEPTVRDSSIGGPLLWPADEPWPTCMSDDQMHAECDAVLIPVAQLYARDVPGLPAPDGTDLLQVLWCPREGWDCLPQTRLVWRDSGAVGEHLAEMPHVDAEAQEAYLPESCIVHPEAVIEYPAALELDKQLRDRITAWSVREGHDPAHDDGAYRWSGFYSDRLSVAPGWKIGGWGNWGVTDPVSFPCRVCDAAMVPLITVDSYEHGETWTPEEDRDAMATGGDKALAFPTGVWIGRGYTLQIYTCPTSPEHGHAQNLQ
jgi:hypothetical protein